MMRDEVDVLLLVDRLELNSVVCVLSPACRTSAVEVFFDMMPTETANLFTMDISLMEEPN